MTAGLILNILTKSWTAKSFFKTRKIFWRSLSAAHGFRSAVIDSRYRFVQKKAQIHF
jgi:hypothetical protein